MTEFNLMLRGIVIKKGDKYSSHCLDVDVYSEGTTPDEAKENLISAVSLYSANSLSPELPVSINENENPFSNDYESIVDEFYFKQNLGILGSVILEDNIPDIPGDDDDEEESSIIRITGRDK